MSIRPVKRLIKSKPTTEGAGVHLRRAFGFGNTSEFDPFLLLDDFRSVAETKSAPQMHPRAFRRRLGFDQSLYRSYGHSGLLHRECTDWMHLRQSLVTCQ